MQMTKQGALVVESSCHDEMLPTSGFVKWGGELLVVTWFDLISLGFLTVSCWLFCSNDWLHS